MLFKPHRSRRIKIDPNAISSSTPEVAERLERIKENYSRLNELLDQIESKLPSEPNRSTLIENGAFNSYEYQGDSIERRRKRYSKSKPR